MVILKIPVELKKDDIAFLIVDSYQNVKHVINIIKRIRMEIDLNIRGVIVCDALDSDWDEELKKFISNIYNFKDSTEIMNNLGNILSVENVTVVMDLSGEPAISWQDRMKLINVTLRKGVNYLGADFAFFPPRYSGLVINKSTISIFGVGKRVGKTSLACHLVELIKDLKKTPIVITMSRKGPPYAKIINPETEKLDLFYLVKRELDGDHATADYLEVSAISDIKTIGCSRVGSGLTGVPFSTIVSDGALMVNDLEGDFVIFEGSGETIPPIDTDGNIFLISGDLGIEIFDTPLLMHRLDRADTVIITGLSKKDVITKRTEELVNFIEEYKEELRVYLTGFEVSVKDNISKGKWLLLTTADDERNEIMSEELKDKYDCDVVGMSGNLSFEELLKGDIERLYEEKTPSGIIMELKGNAVKVAGRFAINKNIDVVFLQNKLVSLSAKMDFDKELTKYLKKIMKEFTESE